MSNHYHAIVRTQQPNLSSAMQHLNGVYAQWWNRRHKRVGHVLQGRFKAQLIQSDRYLLEACRYVVLNPVRAGMVTEVQEWPWSSYSGTAGLAPCEAFLTTSMLLGTSSPQEVREYRAFIAAGVSETEVARVLRSDTPLVGTSSFARAHRSLVEQAHRTEVVRRARAVGRPALAEVFAEVRDKRTRNLRIREARARFGYKVSEIAEYLSLHYGTVSRIVALNRRR